MPNVSPHQHTAQPRHIRCCRPTVPYVLGAHAVKRRSLGASVRSLTLILLPLFTLLFQSCSLTKYVPDDGHLLDRVHIEGDMGNVSSDELDGYVRQQPNTRFLHLWRVGLGVYSLSGRSERRFNEWLRHIGSEPVCYDSTLAQKSVNQLLLYMISKGYYDAQVSDTMVVTDTKRCEVTYRVDAGRIYSIASLSYSVPKGEVGDLILADTANSLLKVGAPFDSNVHDAERERITKRLQDRGFYSFGKDYVYFVADSSGLDHAVRDSLVVVNVMGGADNATMMPHRKAVIDHVTLLVDDTGTGAKREIPDSAQLRFEPADSALLVAYYANRGRTMRGKSLFRSSTLNHSCFIRPGQTYSLSDVEMTRSRFTKLSAFRRANFHFTEVEPQSTLSPNANRALADSTALGTDSVFTSASGTLGSALGSGTAAQSDGLQHLACVGILATNKMQNFGFDVEGTNSSGNLGAAISIRYGHNNIFRGAETLTVKGRLATQRQSAQDGKEDFYTLETGIEVSLNLPFMVLPNASLHMFKRHSPSTTIVASYDRQRRPEFTRAVVAARMSYNWLASSYAQHTITPIEFNIVSIPTISDNFRDYISGTYLQYAYTDHFIMSLGYLFTYNQQRVRRNQSGVFVRFAAETAGNFLNLVTKHKSADEEFKQIWNIRFAQYVKAETEFRYMALDPVGNQMAVRFFAGIGVPYGNSVMMPFEKSYFVGGPNSIRAWAVRGLGPGSQKADPNLRYHNQISDIRLEANAEYRFKIFSIFEGAVFADAGNIWALNRSYNDPDAVISPTFYKQIALGAGLGIRLNFDYFVFRVDAAYKLHDPAADGNKWVVKNRFNGQDIAWNFAIGYPF